MTGDPPRDAVWARFAGGAPCPTRPGAPDSPGGGNEPGETAAGVPRSRWRTKGRAVDEWIRQYGLFAVFVGGVFEGEAVFIAAGYAVSQGYLPLAPTLFLAVLGGTPGDHAWASWSDQSQVVLTQ